MYSGLSDFIKAIPHPSGWDTFPPERSDEGWEATPPLPWIFSCMFSHAIICVHYKKEGGQSAHLYTSWGLCSSTCFQKHMRSYTLYISEYLLSPTCFIVEVLNKKHELMRWLHSFVIG